MSRKLVTERLHVAARRYWTRKGYSVHHEVGVVPWGRRKVDIFAFNMKLDTVVCEVKSGAADFDADKKYRQYLPYCHGFYFVVDQAYWDSGQCDRLRAAAKELGAGVLMLPAGRQRLVSVMRVTKRSKLPPGFLKTTITKLAWRLGYNKGNSR
jgi:hypothetical protein